MICLKRRSAEWKCQISQTGGFVISGEITLIYNVAAVCFILALKGLSSPATARRGNITGIAGMVVAIAATRYYVSISTLPGINPDAITYVLIIAGMVLGGAIGTIIALRIEMKSIPQLVAAFHSLVGLAAVFIAAAAFYSPHACGIGTVGNIKTASLVEMSLAASIGAVTFTGSIVAFAKLQGLVSSAPVVFRGQHLINLFIGLGVIGLTVYFALNLSYQEGAFWLLIALSFIVGLTLIIPIGGCGHARCDLYAELIFRVGRGRNRIYAEQPSPDHHGSLGGVRRSDSQLHHVQGNEQINFQCDSRGLRHRR